MEMVCSLLIACCFCGIGISVVYQKVRIKNFTGKPVLLSFAVLAILSAQLIIQHIHIFIFVIVYVS